MFMHFVDVRYNLCNNILLFSHIDRLRAAANISLYFIYLFIFGSVWTSEYKHAIFSY